MLSLVKSRRVRLDSGTFYGSIKRMLADDLISEAAVRADPASTSGAATLETINSRKSNERLLLFVLAGLNAILNDCTVHARITSWLQGDAYEH